MEHAPPDFYLITYAFLISIVIGIIHANLSSVNSAIWPLKAMMAAVRWRFWWDENYKNYGKDRTEFKFREQCMAAVFIWFWVILFILIILYATDVYDFGLDNTTAKPAN